MLSRLQIVWRSDTRRWNLRLPDLQMSCTNTISTAIGSWLQWTETVELRSRQNGRHFADDIFRCIFLNQNVWIPIKISPKFVHKGPINNNPALIQIMAWCRPGDKPLSETMMVSLPTLICVTRPQWVKIAHQGSSPSNGCHCDKS